MGRMERGRQSDRVLDDELDRDLAALPVHELDRDLAPGVIAALRARSSSPRPDRARRPWPRRLAWVAGSLAVALALGVAAALWLSPAEPPTEPHQVAAVTVCRVKDVLGDVRVHTEGVASPARTGQQIRVSDVIRTGRDSQVELDIDPDARLIVYQETGLEVERLDELVRTFDLHRGRVGVELLNGGKRAVQIRARDLHALAEGRRGAYVALAPGDGLAAFGVMRGSAVVWIEGKRQSLASGQQIRLAAFRPDPRPEPLPDAVNLELAEPSGKLLTPGKTAVRGTSSSHARVWINYQPVALDEKGAFRTSVLVRTGDKIVARAENLLGHEKKIELGPAVEKRTERAPATRPDGKAEVKSYHVDW